MPKAAQRNATVHGKPDYWFDELKEAEYEPCFWHEIIRERIASRCTQIMEQVAELDASGESEDAKFRQKLELQSELDELKWRERPWLVLTDAEKQPFMGSTGSWTGSSGEPVRLAKELTRFERWVRKSRYASGAAEDIELSIDFTKSNDVLKASFLRLIKKMRKEGKAQFEKERRGHPISIELRLFSLSVYRCLQRGMKPDDAWDHLVGQRKKFFIGDHHRTKLDQLVRKIERLIDGPPS